MTTAVHPSPAARRRRVLITLGAISIGWKVVVFTLGAALPRWLIDDGIAALPADAGRAGRCGGYTARVRAYTYFGVPYSEARMVCDQGTVEYRVFRGRGASRSRVD